MKPNKLIKGGLFVSFEGIEGSGKSTQSKMLATRLREKGYSVIETREPGGTQIGEDLRHIVKHISGEEAACDEAELLIFCASRAQLMRKVILPHLKKGGLVVCDRFFDSTTAYQGCGRGLDNKLISILQEFTTFGRSPDITFLLDLEVSKSMDRGRLRSNHEDQRIDRIESESIKFHERVRQGFLSLSTQEPQRIFVINAAEERDLIQSKIIQMVYHALEGSSKNIPKYS